MKITREMVMELNNELAVKGCPFRYEYEGGQQNIHVFHIWKLHCQIWIVLVATLLMLQKISLNGLTYGLKQNMGLN